MARPVREEPRSTPRLNPPRHEESCFLRWAFGGISSSKDKAAAFSDAAEEVEGKRKKALNALFLFSCCENGCLIGDDGGTVMGPSNGVATVIDCSIGKEDGFS